jgi:hypothetical protein
MNVDHILQTLNDHQVRYLLVGGVNFLLRHQPVLTFDVDVWIDPAADNVRRAEQALATLQAEWGPDEQAWGPVHQRAAGWLGAQPVYCLTSPHGAIDVFLRITGLYDWNASCNQAASEKTAGGVAYLGLSDADMLASQEALDEKDRKPDRIRELKRILGEPGRERA